MTEKEYRAQKAIGTVDYFAVALATTSKKVLASIVEDTNDRDTHLAVASNKHTDVRTLTRLIVDIETIELVTHACIFHPAVNIKILETWLKRNHIKNSSAAALRLYTLQTLDGVPASDRTQHFVGPDWGRVLSVDLTGNMDNDNTVGDTWTSAQSYKKRTSSDDESKATWIDASTTPHITATGLTYNYSVDNIESTLDEISKMVQIGTAKLKEGGNG